MARIGPRELIIGKWRDCHQRRDFVVEFAKNGGLRVFIGGAPLTIGTYRFVDDQTIDLKLDAVGPEMKRLKVTVKKDEMTISESNGANKASYERTR